MGLLPRLTEIVKNGEALAEEALESPRPPAVPREHWGRDGAVLWAGDNLEGLARALRGDLEAGIPPLEGQVDLVCTDPPYFRNLQARQRHDGEMTDSVTETRAWHDGGKGGMEGHLTRLHARLVLCHRLLSPRGTLYLQADRILAPWLRVLLDELFGSANFVNEITWKRANAHNDARRFGSVCDGILVYGKGPERIWNPPHRDPAERETDPHWSRDAEGRLFRKVPVDAPRRGKAAARLYAWKGRLPAPGRAWSMPFESMEALEREGRLVETANGSPCRLVYADEMEGPAVQDLWDDVPALSARSPERLDYPAQKPEALVERMLLASSAPGSWVLDPYAGSGTLGAVAARHGRRALLIDSSPAAHLAMRRRLGETGLGMLASPRPASEPAAAFFLRVSDDGICQIHAEAPAPASPWDSIEGWVLGTGTGLNFTACLSRWRERRMGRRGALIDLLPLQDVPPDATIVRLYDIEGRHTDLHLERNPTC